MKMDLGSWIGLIGALVGIAVAFSAVVVIGGNTGFIVIAVMLLVFGGMFYLFYRLFIKPALNARRLQKIGMPATARITSVQDTGVTINNNPQVKLVLDVRNNFGQRYTAECRVLVSRINPAAYAPGMEIPVKIDPADEKNVVIDINAATTTQEQQSNQSINETALKAELEQMQKDNDAIKLSGRSARALVKKYTWLGLYVNGNNPYVELEVEVLPEVYPAFSGKTKGVIAEASVSKFQPGEEIMVKYDYYDNSKMVIEHS
jgi:ribosomal protein L31